MPSPRVRLIFLFALLALTVALTAPRSASEPADRPTQVMTATAATEPVLADLDALPTLPPSTTTTTAPPPPPTTITTQPPAPAPNVVRPAAAASHGDPSDPATWDQLAGCETGYTYDWATNTGNGYYGGLQF